MLYISKHLFPDFISAKNWQDEENTNDEGTNNNKTPQNSHAYILLLIHKLDQLHYEVKTMVI